MNQSDTVLVTWPCYEPAGCSITLTENELVQHVLVLGSTGSGKTTLLTGAIQQLLRQRVGLLILDAKQDGLVQDIAEMASRAGRGQDLTVLGPDGTHVLDLFGALRTYDDVDPFAQWLMLSTDPVNGYDNSYWVNSTSALVAAALTLLVARHPGRVQFGEAVECMRKWFVCASSSSLPEPVADLVEYARFKAAHSDVSPQLLGALDQVELWKTLDLRTRSNLQSCLMNVLRPLQSAMATRCFTAVDRPAFQPAEVASKGKICVVSMNALTNPDLAKFFFRLTRRQFFDAVQSRSRGNHGLCGLVADEFQLIIQPEDADQLATLRSKRCFVMAATQGLAGLDDKLGPRLRRAVLLNFNTVVWMRTREQEAGEFATRSLGVTRIRARSRRRTGWMDSVQALFTPKTSSQDSDVLVCPEGGLMRLQPHQAYVLRADGTRTFSPVWFAPWFELPGPILSSATSGPDQKFRCDANQTIRLMEFAGLVPVTSPTVQAMALALDAGLHERTLKQAQTFFGQHGRHIPVGLELLPASWLAGLPGILQVDCRQQATEHPPQIRRVACVAGVLLVEFVEEEPPGIMDELRILLNRCLYPGQWRPLLRHHQMQLQLEHPELRT